MSRCSTADMHCFGVVSQLHTVTSQIKVGLNSLLMQRVKTKKNRFEYWKLHAITGKVRLEREVALSVKNLAVKCYCY